MEKFLIFHRYVPRRLRELQVKDGYAAGTRKRVSHYDRHRANDFTMPRY
jgi:hypothetical protein